MIEVDTKYIVGYFNAYLPVDNKVKVTKSRHVEAISKRSKSYDKYRGQKLDILA